MDTLKTEHILMVLIAAFLLYHFMGRCGCSRAGNGFRVGGRSRAGNGFRVGGQTKCGNGFRVGGRSRVGNGFRVGGQQMTAAEQAAAAAHRQELMHAAYPGSTPLSADRRDAISRRVCETQPLNNMTDTNRIICCRDYNLKCPPSVPVPPPSPSPSQECQTLMNNVTNVCCNEDNEDCSNGYPTTCNTDCKNAYIPFYNQCRWTEPYNSLDPAKTAILDNTYTLCSPPPGGSGH